MGALADVKQEWRHFREDAPGTRFRNHRARMRSRSRKHSAIALVIGIVLLAGGIVLLFIPGPGLLLIVFGLALIASHSKRLARLLDHAERKLRRLARRTKRRWRAMPGSAKLGVMLAAGAAAGAMALAMWRLVVSPYLLG